MLTPYGGLFLICRAYAQAIDMADRRHTIDTLKIGAGFMGLKEGIDKVEISMLESVYSSAAGYGDVIYDISQAGADLIYILPDNDLLAGFSLAVIANLTAGFIKSEYGGLSNFIRRKKITDEHSYSRFL